VTGASAGSPRLVIAFSDGDSIDLRPLAWTANRWTKVDGASASWEDAGSGGGCATIRDVTYQQALACHLGGGATVSSAYVVADGVAYANGVVVDIDLATYGGADVTSGIKEATAKLQTTTLRVNRKTGRGRLTTGCALPPGDHCHVALTLTHRGQTIGTMTGTLDGSLDGQLKVTLNGRGRGLLQHARKLSAVVSGAIVNDVGFGFRLRESVTIRS
jgi:hypothetical protein